MMLALASILSLNRSIGQLPAHRGIRATGMYRFVRHPMYASYLLVQLGYVASNPAPWNLLVFAAATCAQIVRVRGEEGLLAADPEYVAYAQRTRWRLLPFVF
jgi:protein-S-isoprenylcysteine O-methyltransferase Ste14